MSESSLVSPNGTSWELRKFHFYRYTLYFRVDGITSKGLCGFLPSNSDCKVIIYLHRTCRTQILETVVSSLQIPMR